jgi:hypothetical protein
MKKLKRKIAALLAVALVKLALALSRYARACDAAAHVRITVAIADFPPAVADALIARGVAPAEAARIFSEALQRLQ